MATAPNLIKSTSKDVTFDRVPPQSLEAEIAVLGSMLIDNDSIGKVVELLNPEDFYKTAHRKIFTAATNLYEKNDPVDIISLSEELKRQKILDEVGGAYYLTELAESIPSSANVEYHMRIVHEKYFLRTLIEESANIARDCYEGIDDVYKILDKSEQRIFGLSDKRLHRTFEHINPIMHSAFEVIEKFHEREGGVVGIPTSFSKLDEYTSGLKPGELIIVAGRPSMGKTAFSLNIAEHAALEHKVPVGVFSLEMSNQQLALRLLCSHARIDAHAVRTGNMPDGDWQKLSMTVGTLAEAPLYIDDTPGMGILELRAKARRAKKEYDIQLLVVDYIQLMEGPKGSDSRQQEISTISRSLKGIARELEIPVIVLSQLSRAVETRGGDKRPMLSDLRESGAIEQDADIVIFIFREEFYHTPQDAEAKGLVGKAEAIIRKNRNGPVGTVNLTFLKHYTLFKDQAHEEGGMGAPF